MRSIVVSRIIVKLSGILLLLSAILNVWGAGEVDSTFNGSAYGSVIGSVNIFKRQPDGKILVGGNFYDLNGVAAGGLARLNPDYTVDDTFHPPDFGNSAGLGGTINAIALQPDGKIIVGGNITTVDFVPSSGLKRLFPNGTVDNSFQPPSVASNFNYFDIEVFPDGKILAGGQRLNPDGSVDSSFTTIANVYKTELIEDGKILAMTSGPTTYLRRYNPDGTIDNTFASYSASITDFKSLGSGGVIVGGSGMVRLFPNGTQDPNFRTSGFGFDGGIRRIIPRGDGKYWVAGYFRHYNNVQRYDVALLNNDGSLDNSFPGLPTLQASYIIDFDALPDGKIILGYSLTGAINTLFVHNPDGSLYNSIPVSKGGNVNHITQQPDGKILMTGKFQFANGGLRRSVARLNLDGTLDTSFYPSYFNTIYNFTKIAVQPDSKLVLIAAGSPVLFRMNANGSHDPTLYAPQLDPFKTTLKDITILPDTKILVCGGIVDGITTTGRVFRLTVNGANDPGFSQLAFNGMINRMIVQPDGKILVGGEFTKIGEVTLRNNIARLNEDGSVDPTFNPPGGTNAAITDMQLLADGKIVIGGLFTTVNGAANQNRVARLNADGTLDTSFTQNLVVNNSVTSVVVQNDGKIIVGGNFTQIGGITKQGLAKFNANGTLNSSFNPSVNIEAGVSDVYLQTDGRLLVGGQFTKVNGQSHVRIARLFNETAAPRTHFDYDGDGKADVSVFRASENKWYVLQSSNLQVVEKVFAIAGDIPVPADYDGDGKTDVAIFRPASGDWWYLSSINNAQISVQLGQAGDIPRPSDFDGDGKTDFVVYRPSNGIWYRLSNTGVLSNIAFGAAGDQPLIGDFDGDGKTEPAIFRPSTGDWWYRSSITGQFITVHWGASGDIPVPGDYDADGKTDFVVFRPTDGGWYILYSSGSYTIATFGTVGDKPIAADYDGDGKTDIAVWRPSTGTWYLLQTTSGFGAVNFGVATDIPTENAFVP